QSPLQAIVVSMAASRPSSASRVGVAASLLRLGDLFVARCQFDLALIVAEAALENSGTSLQTQWRAPGACGWAIRMLGGFDRAEIHYHQCVEIGELLDDPDACFRGLKGLAVTARTRGNLPKAEADAARLVAWAMKLGRVDFESPARHDLAVI